MESTLENVSNEHSVCLNIDIVSDNDQFSYLHSNTCQSDDKLKDELSRQLKAMLNIPDNSSPDMAKSKSSPNSQSSKDVSIGSGNGSQVDINALEEKNELDEKRSDEAINSKSLQFNDIRPEFTPPDDELAAKIRTQAENCFSDFNILKDTFLLKHIRSSKEGYISVKLVASFRKVKALTKDWRAVQYSLTKSKFLILNDQGTKVRRSVPVPNFEDTVYAKTVLVFNIPPEMCNDEDLKKFMCTIGETTNIKIITPDMEIPEICTKRCLSVHSAFVENKAFAIIEFQTNDGALKAISLCENTNGVENQLKIVPLMSDSYKNPSNPSSAKRTSKSPKINQNRNDSNNKKSHNVNKKNSSGKRQDKTRNSVSNGSDTHLNNNGSTKYSDKSSFKNFEAQSQQYLVSQSKEREKKKSSPKVPKSSKKSTENANFYGKSIKSELKDVLYPPADHFYGTPSMIPYFRTNNRSKNLIPPVGLRDQSFIPMYPLPYYPSGLPPYWEMDPMFAHKRNRIHQNGYTKSLSSTERDPTLPPNVIRWPKGPDGTVGFHTKRQQKFTSLNNDIKKK